MDDVEQALITRATQGDMDAFEQLVRAHEDRVYRLALKLTDDLADAMEITQDVFLTVYRKLPTLKVKRRLPAGSIALQSMWPTRSFGSENAAWKSRWRHTCRPLRTTAGIARTLQTGPSSRKRPCSSKKRSSISRRRSPGCPRITGSYLFSKKWKG